MAIDTRDGLVPTEGAVSEPKSRMFPIDGREYEIPLLATLDMDEELILCDISGVRQRDFVPAHPDATDEEKALIDMAQMRRVDDPRFKRAMVHIAYRRGNRDKTFDEIEQAVGRSNALDIEIAWLGGDDSPPATSSLTQPESKSSTSEPSSSSLSMKSSGSDSETADVTPLRTGTGR